MSRYVETWGSPVGQVRNLRRTLPDGSEEHVRIYPEGNWDVHHHQYGWLEHPILHTVEAFPTATLAVAASAILAPKGKKASWATVAGLVGAFADWLRHLNQAQELAKYPL